ncbi:MAG: MBL fold metallo-hydrolase, partial [Myxococcota bacterium]
RHLWSRTEIERVRDGGLPDAESLQPLLDAGVVDTLDTPCQLTPHVTLRPSPGHTPGNVDIWIDCDGESAVVVGDQILNPLQCADPDWSGLDMDPAAAPGLRRALLEECEARGTLLIGPHFGSPGAGRVRREGATWRLDAEPGSGC